jgi:hypothetical protein
MKVWRVQKTGKKDGGSVPEWYHFPDSPDEEILAVGFNTGRPYGTAGIGRQGNFLQWGYSAAPSQMTEVGQKLLVNCIHYIHRFDGKPPLVRLPCDGMPRIFALSCAYNINRVRDPKRFFLSTFPEALYEKYHSDPNGLMEYYRPNMEWVYDDRGVFKVDEELKGLGLDSNRKIAGLQRLIELLDDAQHAATAQKLLSRYTECSFETPPQWRQWFDENKNRLYFTDTGGYKFKVVPEGYSVGQSSRTSSR